MDQERAIALAKEEALAKEQQRQAEEKPRKTLSQWEATMAWLADIGNGKNPPEPKTELKPVKPQKTMTPFTFKSSVLRSGKPAEPSAPRKKNSMHEALDFLARKSAKIQAEEATEKAAAREETLRLEAEQQAREKLARERAEQNRREQQEREERERNKKKSRGMDI